MIIREVELRNLQLKSTQMPKFSKRRSHLGRGIELGKPRTEVQTKYLNFRLWRTGAVGSGVGDVLEVELTKAKTVRNFFQNSGGWGGSLDAGVGGGTHL